MKNEKNRKIKEFLVFIFVVTFMIGMCVIIFKSTYEGGGILRYLQYNTSISIIMLFFLGISLYLIYYFIYSLFVSKEKIETLYLASNSTNFKKFLNKKGKLYEYHIENYILNEREFYDVVLKDNMIIKIKGISNNKFLPHYEKVNYWLNWYSPIGNFEGILLLPLVYIFPLLLIFNAFLNYKEAISFFLPGLFCIYLLLYDFNYKRNLIKINKLKINDDIQKEEKLSEIELENKQIMNNVENGWNIFIKIMRIIGRVISIILLLIVLYFVFQIKISDGNNKKEDIVLIILKCLFIFGILSNVFIISFGDKKSDKFDKIKKIIFVSMFALLMLLFIIGIIINFN